MASHTRSARIEVRATAAERELLDRAVAETGSDLTSFVLGYAVQAARRVLADRSEFVLSGESAREWERLNSESPREIAGLREFMSRPSPFAG